MIVRVRAGWVVPVSGPVVRDGWIDVDSRRGTIVAIGPDGPGADRDADRVVDLDGAAVLPGLVNAHTHLELSHLAGAVPPAVDFVAWVRAMLAVRVGTPVSTAVIAEAIAHAIAGMEASGTAGVGDVGNTDFAILPLAASSLSGVHLREALGFRRADAARVAAETRLGAVLAQTRLVEQRCDRLVASVAPHAPYSTSAPLIQALAMGYDATRPVSSIHLAESPEEIRFLATGDGPFRALLDDLGAWDETWTPPGLAPVAYLQHLDVLHERLLVVHGTQLTPDALAAVAASGATLVLCARSNAWVGAGTPPVSGAFASGARIAIGTDSLASVDDLNMFAELRALRRIAPSVPAAKLLEAATLGGARGLGCEGLGRLGPGATSRAVVRVPPVGVADVEEWLVADAADTADLRWLDEIVATATA